MILDKTFCSGARCKKTSECERYHGILKEEAEKNPAFAERLKGRHISMAEFSDHDGECRGYFIPREKDNNEG